jgi:uncharacterized protein YhfF
MRRPLPPIEAHTVAQFWQRAQEAGSAPPDTPIPSEVGPFGDHADLADDLITLVLQGRKRATAGAVAEYTAGHEPIPKSGDLWIVTDGAGQPRAVLRCTDIRIGPLSSVDDAFAWDEGEGDRTRSSWLEAHRAYLARVLPSVGADPDPETPVVFTRFDVTYQE